MLNKISLFVKNVGGAVASPDRTFRVRVLTEDDSAFCSWARHLTLEHSVCLHPGV